jgi:hypothetical protein
MSNYAVLRVGKLKTRQKITACQKHNQRVPGQKLQCNFADPELTHRNQALIPRSKSLWSKAKEIVGENGGVKVRSNAVLAMEFLLSASPTFFRENENDFGVYDEKLTEKWARKSAQWLMKKYGENLISCDLHLDEKTPHIHAVVVPMSTKKNKHGKTVRRLCARDHLHGKVKLQQLQTDYHKSVEFFGLLRGKKGSKDKHTRVSDYHKQTCRADKIRIKKPSPVPRSPSPPAPKLGLGYTTSQVEELSANYDLEIKRLRQQNVALLKQLQTVIKRSHQIEILKEKNEHLKDRNATVESLQQKIEPWKEVLDRLKTVPKWQSKINDWIETENEKLRDHLFQICKENQIDFDDLMYAFKQNSVQSNNPDFEDEKECSMRLMRSDLFSKSQNISQYDFKPKPSKHKTDESPKEKSPSPFDPPTIPTKPKYRP